MRYQICWLCLRALHTKIAIPVERASLITRQKYKFSIFLPSSKGKVSGMKELKKRYGMKVKAARSADNYLLSSNENKYKFFFTESR